MTSGAGKLRQQDGSSRIYDAIDRMRDPHALSVLTVDGGATRAASKYLNVLTLLGEPADRILHAIDEAIVAVRIPHDAIAGVKPEIPPSFDGRASEIAGGECEGFVETERELARLSLRKLRIVRIDDTG